MENMSNFLVSIVPAYGPVQSSVKAYTDTVMARIRVLSLQWRHNEHDGVSSHQPHDCLLNILFWRRSQETWKLRVTGLCAGNSPITGEFPAQRAGNAENVSIWWRHHVHLRNRHLNGHLSRYAWRLMACVWRIKAEHSMFNDHCILRFS